MEKLKTDEQHMHSTLYQIQKTQMHDEEFLHFASLCFLKRIPKISL